eukprot:TRINITY_DN3527_c0_g1_i1.p1 TRINITY_DN3527_c0_g1~~TRINITY_DN3527_c0_g1_i1.p1  ORF type:complete len:451 (+),score=121.21 TRINITY_DN3527_c0_g1_i1:23-1375(+)
MNISKFNRNDNSKKKKIIISSLLFLIVVIFVLLFQFVDIETDQKFIDEYNNSIKQKENKIDSIGEINKLNNDAKVSREVFRLRSKERHEIRQRLLDSDDKELENKIKSRCSKLKQTDQLKDSECTAIWLNELRHGFITNVLLMWGFEDTHYGAITLELEFEMRAMFKPCTTRGEDTTKELIASHIDQVLGYGQVAPVITRRIPVAIIEKYIETEEDRIKFDETVKLCSVDGYFVGPMIGWWDGLVPVRTIRKYKQPVELVKESRDTLKHDLYYTQDQSKFHSFYMLVDILRHGKDEFVTKTGDLVSLDLDRSRFKPGRFLKSHQTNYTWCYTCFLSQQVYDTFQAIGPSQPIPYRLSSLLKVSLKYEDIFENLYNPKMGLALDDRVEQLLSCIDECIDELGENNVLLNVPRPDSNKEIVKYYVTHSQYKDRNGQEGPSNLNFLYQDDDWD